MRVIKLAKFLQPLGFSDCPGWEMDDQSLAFHAFRRSADYTKNSSYKSGSLGISFEALKPSFVAARKIENPDKYQARAFFEAFFIPCLIAEPNRSAEPPLNTGDDARGFVTGYYEPIIKASRQADDRFKVPFLSPPDDLVKIADKDRPTGLDPSFRFARKTQSGLKEYDDRRAIEQGSLAGRGLELAFVESRIDAFFAHIQGAARLEFADGTTMRITYAAKTGHPFTAIGRILVDDGELSADAVTMRTIRQWLQDNPERADELMWRNRSYIFFREAPVDAPNAGPIAAAKVPLTPGRSMAVDRNLHSFGTPFFVNAPHLTSFDNRPFSRLMIGQDTGTAIVGPARGDLFAGSGDMAGEIAGGIKHRADFYALVPRQLVEA